MKEFYLKRRYRKRIKARVYQLKWMLKKRKKLPENARKEIVGLLEKTQNLLANSQISSANLKQIAERLDTAVTKTFKQWKQPVVWQTFDELWLVVLLALTVKFFFLGSFRVPSGSMMDTILIGDNLFVLMNRYGLTVPFGSHQFVSWGNPSRGDIVTFVEPVEDGKALVKRVIGLPGDSVFVSGSHVKVNGVEMRRKRVGTITYTDSKGNVVQADKYRETNKDGVSYDILLTSGVSDQRRQAFEERYCRFCGFEFVVPEGQLFVMGDNRDNSYDSRFWGFVPRRNLQGMPLFIWFSIQFGDSIFDVVDFRPFRIGHIIR